MARQRRQVGEVREERRRGHGEGRAGRRHARRRLRRIPDIVQHRRHAEHDRQHHAVHEAGLVRQRRRHPDHVLRAHAEPRDDRRQAGEQRVRGMHDALRLPRGAGRVEDLGHIVRPGAGAGERGRRVGARPLEEEALEGVRAAAADVEAALELRQLVGEGAHHRGIVEPAEPRRSDIDLGLREAQHEAQLARPKDRHERIADRAGMDAGEMERRELPPVGELEGNHVARLHAQLQQPQRDAPRRRVQLGIGEGGLGARLAVLRGNRRAPGMLRHGRVQVVEGRPARPVAARFHRGDAFRREDDPELHRTGSLKRLTPSSGRR